MRWRPFAQGLPGAAACARLLAKVPGRIVTARDPTKTLESAIIEIHKDVLIIGSGAAGMTAAITAALGGCSVLVVEKADLIGGTTAISGGGAWLPMNPHMVAYGAADDRGAAETYIRSIVGNYYDAAMVDAFLDHSGAMVSFLEQHSSAVRFQPYPCPDYHPELPGAAKAGRSVLPKPFDGRELGPWLPRLRDALPELTVFGGMQVDAGEAVDLQYLYKSWRSFNIARRLITRYIGDRLVHHRGTRMIRGVALAARLLRSALDAGADVWSSAPAERLIVENGRVVGAIVTHKGENVTIRATRGVVLATGGFSANPDMVAKHIPYAETHVRVLPETNTGDGITMAQAIGADLGPKNAANAIWAPGSSRQRKNGEISAYPHFAFDRCKPGAMIVDRNGERFANEAQSYHTLVNTMHERGAIPAWLIADHAFLRKYGMGLARPAPYPYRYLVREGYLIEAATIAELATRIQVPAAALSAQVERMNHFAKTGVDEDFGKGGDAYNRMLGDAAHRPNPCLGPIAKGPFYALALYATNAGTTLGLRSNAQAQVLDTEGQPIEGLYAAGLDMNAALRGHYPGAGTSIGPAMTFGYIAGLQLARRDGASPEDVAAST